MSLSDVLLTVFIAYEELNGPAVSSLDIAKAKHRWPVYGDQKLSSDNW
jgi:hypothetical protein